jgi:hypothetical protein
MEQNGTKSNANSAYLSYSCFYWLIEWDMVNGGFIEPTVRCQPRMRMRGLIEALFVVGELRTWAFLRSAKFAQSSIFILALAHFGLSR